MKVIIIYGSKTYVEKPSWLKGITYKISTYLCNGKPSYDWAYNFKKYLVKKGIKAEVFKWNGEIWLRDIREASERLVKLLKKKKGKVILFCKSSGGLIAQLAIPKCRDKISKIIQIATPNLSKDYSEKIPIINIYSKLDKLQRNGILLYSFLKLRKGSRFLEGVPVENKIFNNFSHRDFNSKKMFKLYYRFIKDNPCATEKSMR